MVQRPALLTGWSPTDRGLDWAGARPQEPLAVAMASTSWPWHRRAPFCGQAGDLSTVTLAMLPGGCHSSCTWATTHALWPLEAAGRMAAMNKNADKGCPGMLCTSHWPLRFTTAHLLPIPRPQVCKDPDGGAGGSEGGHLPEAGLTPFLCLPQLDSEGSWQAPSIIRTP